MLTGVHAWVIACELVSKSVCSNACISASRERGMTVANCVLGRGPVANCVRNSLQANYRTGNLVLFNRIKVAKMARLSVGYTVNTLKGCSDTQFATGYTQFAAAVLRILIQENTPFATGSYAIYYRKLRSLLQVYTRNCLASLMFLCPY